MAQLPAGDESVVRTAYTEPRQKLLTDFRILKSSGITPQELCANLDLQMEDYSLERDRRRPHLLGAYHITLA